MNGATALFLRSERSSSIIRIRAGDKRKVWGSRCGANPAR